jgi:hypothetical protein
MPLPALSGQTWSPPTTLPNLPAEYASIRLEPVQPIPAYVTRAYERYLAKKEELIAEKAAIAQKLADLEEKMKKRDDGKYRPRGSQDDPVMKGMRDDIAKETTALKGMGQSMDALDDENKAVEEYMAIHKKMEESYVLTKTLQEDSRQSWATMYSSV